MHDGAAYHSTGLVLGYYNPSQNVVPSLPEHKAFLSVSLGHSRKPLLVDILSPYIQKNHEHEGGEINVLELFGRTAVAGKNCHQLTVGNEPVKFNALSEEGDFTGWICNSES